jgi:hypothetical protein
VYECTIQSTILCTGGIVLFLLRLAEESLGGLGGLGGRLGRQTLWAEPNQPAQLLDRRQDQRSCQLGGTDLQKNQRSCQ